MTHCKLAADEMAHLFSQCYGGVEVIDVIFLAMRISLDLKSPG